MTDAPDPADVSSRTSPRRGVRALALDIGPLRRSRDFRRLWTGELVSQTGTRVTLVAVYVQVFRLTHSSAAVGLVGLAQVVPLIVSTLGSGPIIDRHDRRLLLVRAQLAFTVSAGVLVAGALAGHPPVLLIYGAVALTSAVNGLASPTRAAATPNVVSRADLPAALVLNQVMWNTCLVLGPAIGGVLVARLGLAWAYGFDGLTYLAGAVFALRLRPLPVSGSTAPTRTLDSLRQGFVYLRGQQVLLAIFAVDLVAMVFGMPRALFPQLAREQFADGAQVVGALLSAVGFGGLVGALSAGWVGRVRRPGRAVLIAVAIWGAGITAFGLVGGHLAIALTLLALAGAADMLSAVFRGTILQTTVPDELRGRLSAINILVVMGGPGLGDLEAGLVAAALSPTISVVSGGIACIVGVVVVRGAFPEFARYLRPRDTDDGVG